MVVGLSVVGIAASADPGPPPGYVAIPELSDEFDGITLDAAKWSEDGPNLHTLPVLDPRSCWRSPP